MFRLAHNLLNNLEVFNAAVIVFTASITADVNERGVEAGM